MRHADDEGAVSFAILKRRRNLAAVGSCRLLRPTRLARHGAPPLVDALERGHGHRSPSQAVEVLLFLDWEFRAEVRAHQRRRLGDARLPADEVVARRWT